MRGAPVLVLIAAVFALSACPAQAPVTPPPPPPPPMVPVPPPPPARADGRLPALATPVSVELAMEIDPTQPTFRGTERIVVDVPAETWHVVLHSHALAIADARALLPNGEAVSARTSARPANGDKNDAPEELVLTFARPLPPGRSTIALAWSGAFDGELRGLYRVQDHDAWYAFTQFEAVSARRAFPSFDEPSFKVPWEVSVTAPKGMIAVANGPEVARRDHGTKTTFHFAPTPPMPSYLVAFAVGDFDVLPLASRTTSPPVRLISTKGKSVNGALAIEATGEIVDALASWFGIPYPYAKLDIVAVPDFSAGAMENAGLITFRESLLLLDPARASVRSRRNQALVIAHELAHHWFGDLVTADWWNDLWLNEGMATWMEAHIVEAWRPAWGARTDAIADSLGVMDTDALASARAVRQPVSTSAEAEEAFDGITYEKGAAVLATIEQWVGAEAFQRGVREYLRENAWKSVKAEKLLGALDRATGKNVTEMASTFLDKPGVPVVTAHLSCERGSRWNVELSQEPWRPLGSKVPDDEGKSWVIPVCAAVAGEKKPVCAELAHGAPSLLAGRGCPAWIHPNAFATYYRFALDEAGFAKLGKARSQLDVAQRITLVSDANASMRAGKLKPKALLDLLPAFDDESARQVVSAVSSALGTIDSLLDDETRPAFRKYATARLAKQKKNLGWLPHKGEATSGDEAILRHDVLDALADIAGDETTLREAEEFATKWLADQTSIDSDTAATAVPLASRRASAARLDQLRDVAKHAKTEEDRTLALRAIGGFDDPTVLEKALDLVLTDEIRVQDVRYVLSSAIWRRASRPATEKWIRAHWDALRKKLPGELGTGLVAAAGVACTKADVEESVKFYAPRAAEIEGGQRAFAEYTEQATLCAELKPWAAPLLAKALAK